MKNQWIVPGKGIPFIEVDISTLGEDDAVMKFYRSLIMLACGTSEVKDLNVLEFSENKALNFPKDPAKKGYFVRFKKGVDSITVLIMSGNLYFESFQINNGTVYVLGNNQTMVHETNMDNYNKVYSKYKLDMEEYSAIKEASKSGGRKVKMPKPKMPKMPQLPEVYQMLEHYGLHVYQNLEIGSSYPKLQLMANKNRKEILFGMNSLHALFDRLLKFNPLDPQTAAEGGLFGAVFVSESVRLLDQATEMQDFFRDVVNNTISNKNWKMHLSWAFGSKVLGLKMHDERRGVPHRQTYRVRVEGELLDESDLEKSFWTLRNANLMFGAEGTEDEDKYLVNNIYDLDRRSVDFK